MIHLKQTTCGLINDSYKLSYIKQVIRPNFKHVNNPNNMCVMPILKQMLLLENILKWSRLFYMIYFLIVKVDQ